jgi:rhamnose utilization protein RhaD (predicted bifunctional aldolase and dehydrogenase)
MSDLEQKRRTLLALSHELGEESRELSILGEGNTSARLSKERFLVKASGCNLGTLREEDTVECLSEPLLELLGQGHATDEDVDLALVHCKVDPKARRPSVEALFHAYFLSLPGVEFVGHTHPIAINSLLCSTRANDFAERRTFPDEIVCCGPASVLVPYTDPGLWLGQEIRRKTEAYIERYGALPKVVLLQSHGVITFGPTPEAVKAAMYMAVKAARIFAGAAALGGPVFLSQEVIDRIGGRKDEHYRQAALTSTRGT